MASLPTRREQPFKNALFVLLYFIGVYAALRALLHSVLHLSLGWFLFTDYDFIFPLPVSILLLFLSLQYSQVLNLGLQKKALISHLILILAFVVFTFLNTKPIQTSTGLLRLLWFLLGFATLLSGFFVWVPFSFYRNNPNRFAIVPCLLIAFCMFLYRISLAPLWKWLCPMLAHTVYLFGRPIWGPTTHYFIKDESIYLSHAKMGIRIEMPCGGFDGIFLFILCLSLFKITLLKPTRNRDWFLALLMGIPFMYLLNVFRIFLLFSIGIVLGDFASFETTAYVVTKVFDANAGWLIYGLGISTYLLLLLKPAHQLRTESVC